MSEVMIDEVTQRKELQDSSELQVREILEETREYNEAANDTIAAELNQRRQTQIAQQSQFGERFPYQFRNLATKASTFLIRIIAGKRDKEEKKEKPKMSFSETLAELISFSESYITKLGNKESRHSVGKNITVTLTPEQSALIPEIRARSFLANLLEATLKSYLIQRGELQRDIVVENTAYFVISQFINSFPGKPGHPGAKELIKGKFGDTKLMPQIQTVIKDRYVDVIRFAQSAGIELPDSLFEDGQLKAKTPQEAIGIIGTEKFSNALVKFMLSSALNIGDKDLFDKNVASTLLSALNNTLNNAGFEPVDGMHFAAHTLNFGVLDSKDIYKRVEVYDNRVEFKDDKIVSPNIMIELGNRMFQIPLPNETKILTDDFDKKIKEIVIKAVDTIFSTLESGVDPFSSEPVDFSRNRLIRALASFSFLNKKDRKKILDLTKDTIGLISFRPFNTFDTDLSTGSIPITTYIDVKPSETGFNVSIQQSLFHAKTDGEDGARGINRLVQGIDESSLNLFNYYSQYFKERRGQSLYTEIMPSELTVYFPRVTEGSAQISIPTDDLRAIQKICREQEIFDPDHPDRISPRLTITSAYIALANLLISSNQDALIEKLRNTVNYKHPSLIQVMDKVRRFAGRIKIGIPKISFSSEQETTILGIVLKTKLRSDPTESEFPAMIRQILSGSLKGMNEVAINEMLVLSNLAITNGGTYDLIYHLLKDLPEGEQPYIGTVASPGKEYPGVRITAYVPPGHWGDERAYRKKEFENLLITVEELNRKIEAGETLSEEELNSLKRMKEHLARVLLANEDILVEERDRSLSAKSLAILAQETITKLGVAGRAIESFLKGTFPKLFSSIAANASVQSIGGVSDQGEYVDLNSSYTSQLYELQRLRRHFMMARGGGDETKISNRYVPGKELNEIAKNHFILRLYQSSIIEQFSSGETNFVAASEKACQIIANLDKNGLVEIGSQMIYKSMLDAVTEGQLNEMARYARTIRMLDELTTER